MTIVGDPNQTLAAAFQLDVDTAGTRVKRVFDQLLDHRSRAFNNLSCRDTRREGIWHDFYGHETSIPAIHQRIRNTFRLIPDADQPRRYNRRIRGASIQTRITLTSNTVPATANDVCKLVRSAK